MQSMQAQQCQRSQTETGMPSMFQVGSESELGDFNDWLGSLKRLVATTHDCDEYQYCCCHYQTVNVLFSLLASAAVSLLRCSHGNLVPSGRLILRPLVLSSGLLRSPRPLAQRPAARQGQVQAHPSHFWKPRLLGHQLEAE